VRKLLGVFLAASLVLCAPVAAQEETRPGFWEQWYRWLVGGPKAEPQATSVHPLAPKVAATDRAREGNLQQAHDQLHFAQTKARIQQDLRFENNRQIATAIANKAPAPPFRESVKTGIEHEASPASPLIIAPDPTAAQTPDHRPGYVAGPTPTPAGLGQKAAAAADAIVNNVGQTLFGPAAAPPLHPGLFVLALVGIFVVPAAGGALVLIGLAHLRGHSFTSGTVIITLGALILWGSYTAARMIDPDLLGGPAEVSPPADEPGAGPTAMRALRPDAPWNNY
jgi:hypothetical protein